MSKDTIIIGCKLPNGLILEVGYEIEKGTGQKIMGADYAKIVLRGWNEHTASARQQGIQTPSPTHLLPYLNRGVSKAAWNAWKTAHPKSWLLKNEILFEAADEASAQIRLMEADSTPAILAPIDRAKPVGGVTEADFTKKTPEKA